MRKFGPRPEDGEPDRICHGCGKPFKKGDYTTLVPIGPGDDEESGERAAAGRVYNAVAIEVHWDCAAPEYKTDRP